MEGRRALTMIETLATVAILAAIAALALPALDAWLARARSETALAHLSAAVGAGRVKARQSGRAVELVAREAARGTELVLEPLAPAALRGSGEEGEAPAGSEWLGTLPDGWSISEAEGTGGSETAEGAPESGRIVIALCLPDGLIAGKAGIRLGRRDELFDISIARWTGETVASPVAAEEGVESPSASARPPAPDEAPLGAAL